MQMDVEFKRNQGRKEKVWLLFKDKNREKTTVAVFSHSSMILFGVSSQVKSY